MIFLNYLFIYINVEHCILMVNNLQKKNCMQHNPYIVCQHQTYTFLEKYKETPILYRRTEITTLEHKKNCPKWNRLCDFSKDDLHFF